jgi:hypothetical protein
MESAEELNVRFIPAELPFVNNEIECRLVNPYRIVGTLANRLGIVPF